MCKTESSKYQSSVLQCNVEDHECPVCRFLNGSLATDDLLRVIGTLDKELGALQVDYRRLVSGIAKIG